MTLADRVFAAQIAMAKAEDELTDAVMGWLGVAQDAEKCPWINLSWDYYDDSLELHGCPVDLRLTRGEQGAAWEAGFKRIWLNHRDGSETYYSEAHPEGQRGKDGCMLPDPGASK